MGLTWPAPGVATARIFIRLSFSQLVIARVVTTLSPLRSIASSVRDSRRIRHSVASRCIATATIGAVADMLTLSAHLPELDLAPGEVVVREGGESGGIWVLVSGALLVRKGDEPVNTITHPGALVGEMSILLGTDHGATVEATEPSRLRYADDGHALLMSDPAITELVAIGLAERLRFRHQLSG